MKIYILPPTGIQPSEKYAIQRLEKEFSSKWLGYASLEIIQPRQIPREIDLVLLTNDRVLIIELKRWNGVIKSDGDFWYLKRPRSQDFERMEKSPIKKNVEKARILKSVLVGNVDGAGGMFVDHRVILCGNSPTIILPENEKPSVLQLDEFLTIKEPKHYQRLLPPTNEAKGRNWTPSDPLVRTEQFDKLFRRSMHIRPRVFSWQNYKLDGAEIFRHPEGLYSEFKSVNCDDVNAKALLRKWDFSKLGTAASTQGDWINIAQREARVFSFVRSRTDELEGVLLAPIGTVSADEVTQEHCELFDLPLKQKRLSEFIEIYRGKISLSDRVALVKVLLSKFAELHRLGIAHRDIGDHCVWLQRPQSVRLSGFITAHFPQMDTIGVVKERVSAITTKLPEDFNDEKAATPFHRDVFLLGLVAHLLIFESQPRLDDDLGLPLWQCAGDDLARKLDPWFARSLSWEVKDRWRDAGEMLDALNAISLVPKEIVIPLSVFDHFQAITKPNQYHALGDPVEQNDAEVVKATYEGKPCLLKIWYGLKPVQDKPELNHMLLTFLEKARAIRSNPSDWLPKVIDVGLTNRGLLYSREWIDLQTLSKWLHGDRDQEDRVQLCLNIIEGIESLHGIKITHGDIHPNNILVRPPGDGFGFARVVFIDTPDIKNGSTDVVTTAYAPANFERLSLEERDRFGVVAVLTEILGSTVQNPGSGEFPIPAIYAELEACLKSGLPILTLDHLAKLLQKALSEDAESSEPIIVRFRRLGGGLQTGPMLSDNGVYYVERQYKDAERDRIFIAGPGLQLRLQVETNRKALIYLDSESITHQNFQRKAYSGIRFEGSIVIEESTVDDASDLIARLFELPTFQDRVALPPQQQVDSRESDIINDEAPKERTEVLTRDIWQNLIEAEIDALPEIEILGDSRPHPKRPDVLLVPYRCATNFEYAPDEEVVVYQEIQEGERRKVAILEHRLTDDKEIALRNTRFSIAKSIGAKFVLQSKRDESSYKRRQEAIERILSRRSTIPDLTDYFEKTAGKVSVSTHPAPTDEELARYDIFDGERRIFSLNDDQKAAFKTIYSSGPLSLLQGPPGTGKTSFIAAFLHYLIATKGAQHILLVSQSHEATNNALEGVLELSWQTNTPVEVVRVGEDAVLSEAIKHVGVSAIQESVRERFRSEFKQRVSTLSVRLGLKLAFVEDYCDSMIHITRLADDIKEIEKQWIVKTIDENDRGQLKQTLDGRRDTLLSHASLVADFDRDATVEQIVMSVEDALVLRHGIRNPSAVQKLKLLVRISSEWIDVLGSAGGNFAEFLAKTRTLVAGTCVGVGRWNLGVSRNVYDWVVIDEAARASPSELAVAMQVGRRVLLVGDHFQLPPFYKDELRSEMSKRFGVQPSSDIFDSDFERAFESEYGKVAGASLSTQYRMAPAIRNLVSNCFYAPRGRVLKQGRPAPDHYFNNLSDFFSSEVTWVDTSEAGQEAYEQDWRIPRKKDYRNLFEAKAILDVLKHIVSNEAFMEALARGHKLGEQPIGIIAMYSAQVKEIVRAIARTDWIGSARQMIKVDTVDSYQGKENRIIIVSLVRNNPDKRQGFLYSPNRLNVAMSRAMDRLIIVGASKMWRNTGIECPLANVVKHIDHSSDEARFVDANSLRGSI